MFGAGITCRCVGCKRDRDIELSRRENGGALLPIVAEHEAGKDYSAETAEPCSCGSRRVVIRLRFGVG